MTDVRAIPWGGARSGRFARGAWTIRAGRSSARCAFVAPPLAARHNVRVTPFRFEHQFRAPSVDAVLAAAFDPTCQAEQDRAIDIAERTVLEHAEVGDEVRRVCRVVPRRQLPAIVRPLIPGQLHYTEHMRWSRPDRRVDLELRPSLMGGRAVITARYTVGEAGPGRIRRVYAGTVAVEIAVLGPRIERGIVAELARATPVTAQCTQEWLDRSSAAWT